MENVLLIDADFLDSVAADMRLNFSRMLNRDIAIADLASWLVCAALDGGVPEDEQGNSQNKVQVVMIRSLQKTNLEHFEPSNMLSGIDGKAFNDPYMGEFLLSVVPEEKPISDGEPLFVESARYLKNSAEIKRLVLVPDMLGYGSLIKEDLEKAEGGPDTVLLTMQPEEGRGFTTEILGYSLMHALGIAPEELK